MYVIHLYVTNGLENTEYGPELMDPYIIKPQARHHYSLFDDDLSVLGASIHY